MYLILPNKYISKIFVLRQLTHWQLFRVTGCRLSREMAVIALTHFSIRLEKRNSVSKVKWVRCIIFRFIKHYFNLEKKKKKWFYPKMQHTIRNNKHDLVDHHSSRPQSNPWLSLQNGSWFKYLILVTISCTFSSEHFFFFFFKQLLHSIDCKNTECHNMPEMDSSPRFKNCFSHKLAIG